MTTVHKEPVLNFSIPNDTDLKKILEENLIALTPEEARKVVKMLERNPTLTEATIFSIQGSEHSSYKSSRKFLKNLPTSASPVILGPKEDAGIVEMCEINGEKYGIVYSHESHNSPSQIVPFEGAATGVGGICRDIACMGARVIGSLDGLRFGNPKKIENKVIARGAVSGIAGYGNPLGVPNMGGDIFFDPSFDGFTLVNVVALGLVKENNILHSYAPKNAADDEYEFIVVGKASDRSGFGGASFSSSVVDESKKEKNLGAVQEPNPFLERHLLAAFQDLFYILERIPEKTDLRLKSEENYFDKLKEVMKEKPLKKSLLQTIGLKDMGAGGIMCATVELAESGGFGAEIHVENIHTGEDNLPPHIIFCSETQERFCFVVPPNITGFFLYHFNEKWDFPNVSTGARASKIGKITHDDHYIVKYKTETICHAKASDITAGLLIDRPYDLPSKEFVPFKTPKIENLSVFLSEFMARPNLANRECVSENYDQSVQNLIVKERKQTEAVIVAPLRDFEELSENDKKRGFAVSIAGSPHLGGLSSYYQGIESVVTAIQKVAATGARPRALTDCLNYGNPERKDDMGKFIDGIQGVAAGAKGIHLYEFPNEPTPFISGNVSLYKRGNPSAICSCIGVFDDTTNGIGNIVKNDEALYLLGGRPTELGGTEFASTFNEKFGYPAEINLQEAEKLTHFMIQLVEEKIASASSVIAEGGLIATFLKMCFRSNLGFIGDFLNFSLEELFSEGNGFLVSTTKEKDLEKLAEKREIPITKLGKFQISDQIEGKSFSLSLKEDGKKWKKGLRKEVF